MAAADVGHAAPPARAWPTTPSSAGSHDGHEVRVVAGAEEPLAALEDVVVVLVPADARPALRNASVIRGASRTDAERELEDAGQEGRAATRRSSATACSGGSV